MQNHGARVNIKYNHADSKVTYLVGISRCHEYIFNESSIPSFEIQVNLCEPITSVSSLNYVKLSLIYLVKSLEMLCVYIYNAIFTIYLIFYYYCSREFIVTRQCTKFNGVSCGLKSILFLNYIHQIFPQSSHLTYDCINRFTFSKQTLLPLSIYFQNKYYWPILIDSWPNLTIYRTQMRFDYYMIWQNI